MPFVPDECVAFVKRQAESLDLPLKIYHIYPKKPIVVLTWVGTRPTKPSILLNSHMDVVPVFEVSVLTYGKDTANVCVCVYNILLFAHNHLNSFLYYN